MPYLDISHLCHSYVTDRGSVDALNEVSACFDEGDTVCVLGPSGCGKSTLLRCIAGLIEPSKGTIVIDGGTPEYARTNKLIGLAFQDPTLLKWRTVRQNILLPAELGSPPRRGWDCDARLDELLRLTRMEDFKDALPSELSGGMQRRVALARALLLQPKLLLLDEPLTGLDFVTSTELMIEIGDVLQRSGVTSLIVTHSVEEAVFLGTSIVLLSKRPGRVLDIVKNPEPRPRVRSYPETGEFGRIAATCRRVLLEGGTNIGIG